MEKVDLSKIVSSDTLAINGLNDGQSVNVTICEFDRSITFHGTEDIKKYACLRYGKITYLTDKERIRIIQNDWEEDFDVLPKNFDGPTMVTESLFKRVMRRDLGIDLIREWDGTLSAVETTHFLDAVRINYGDLCYEIPREEFDNLHSKVFSEH